MEQRQNSRLIKPRKDKKGRLLCLVPTCNKLRQKYKTGNRTRNYCKDHNFWDMREFTSWVSIRIKALKRDNHTCVKCGYKGNAPYSDLIGDHIESIALGGEEFDVDNVQTLCIPCDKIKTKEDQAKIGKQRRIEKVQEKNKTLVCS